MQRVQESILLNSTSFLSFTPLLKKKAKEQYEQKLRKNIEDAVITCKSSQMKEYPSLEESIVQQNLQIEIILCQLGQECLRLQEEMIQMRKLKARYQLIYSEDSIAQLGEIFKQLSQLVNKHTKSPIKLETQRNRMSREIKQNNCKIIPVLQEIYPSKYERIQTKSLQLKDQFMNISEVQSQSIQVPSDNNQFNQ